MISVLVVMIAVFVMGWPAAKLIGVPRSAPARIGISFLLGAALVAAVLFLNSVLGVAWSRVSFLLAVSLTAAGLWWFGLKRTDRASELFVSSSRRFAPLVMLTDLATFLLVVGHALYATAAAPFETDFLSIWGLKARAFSEHAGIDWEFLASPWNFFSHPDYPLLLPLLYDAVSVIEGGWNDRWLGLFTTMFGAAALLSVRGLLRNELPAVFSALIAFALASMMLSPWIGMAEAPLIAYATVGLLLVRRARLSPEIGGDRQVEWTAGAWLLACGAMTKNEGEAFVISVVAALVLTVRGTRLSNLIMLWPAVVVVLGWRLMRALMGLDGYLTLGSPLSRAASVDLPEMVRFLWLHGAHTTPWLGFALAALVTLPGLVRRERFLLVVGMVQLAFYVTAYAITPHGVEWQIRWSWERLVTHVLPLVTLALLITIARTISSTGLSVSMSNTEAGNGLVRP